MSSFPASAAGPRSSGDSCLPRSEPEGRIERWEFNDSGFYDTEELARRSIEPGLFIFPSAAAAACEIEPFDAESEIRAAFDESAVPYRVEWLRPNRHSKTLFGLLTSIEPGEYRLVAAGPPDPVAFVNLLENHLEHTQPPEAKVDLEALLAKVRAV